MNGFYILAHDQTKLQTSLDIVDEAIADLKVHHQGNSIGSEPVLSIFLSPRSRRSILRRQLWLWPVATWRSAAFPPSIRRGSSSTGRNSEPVSDSRRYVARASIRCSFRSKQFDDRSLLPPNALFEKGMIYLDLKQRTKANEHFQRTL